MAINTQKLVPSSFGSQQVSQKKLIEVKRSVIDVEKLMTGIVAFEKKQQDAQRKSREEKRYQKRENDLERKTIKKQFKMNLPSLPRMGFFDWIKNFVTNTLLGFFAVRLLKYVPQLVGVAGLALNAAEGIFNFAGGLLNGAATFVEWGYKAYDATRGFLKQIAGENFTQLFDKFLGGLDLFLTLSLGATLITGFDKLKRSIGDTARRALVGGAAGAGTGAGAASQRARSATFTQRRASARTQRTTLRGRRLANAVFKRQIIRKAPAERELAGAAGASGTRRGEDLANRYSKIRRQGDLLRAENDLLRKSPQSARGANSRRIAANNVRIKRLQSVENRIVNEIKSIQQDVKPKISKRLRPTVATPEGPIITSKNFSKRLSITPEEMLLRAERGQTDFSEFAKSKFGMPKPGTPNITPRVSGTKSFLRQAKGIFGRFKVPIIGALLDFALSVALGEDPGRAAFKAIGAGLLGGVLGAAGSVVPVIGNFIGGLIGGAAGDLIGGALYDLFFGNKKLQTPQQNPQGFASGGEVGRGPRKRIKKRREYLSQPSQDPIELGKDVGKKKFEEMFPKGSSGGLFGIGSKEDAYGYLESGFGVLSGTSFFGPLFGIAIKSLTGDKPSSSDYRAASFGLSNWMTSTFGNVAMQGFANGGLVGGGLFLDSRQIQKTIESSLESRITSEVDDAINELRRRLGIEGKDGKTGGGGSTTSPDGYNEKPSSSTSGTGGDMVRSAEGTKLAAELGRFIQSKLSSPEDYNRITEHPEFGGSFKRNYNSWHNVDRAIDIGAYSYEQQKILDAIEEFNKQRGVQPVELLHAGNDPTGLHDDHVHVAYFGGGSTGKGGVIRVHEDEWVVDKDSKNLYGNAFLHLINSTENESQRKQNSLRLMSILQSYAGYESGFEQTVTVPVPTPQMIPIPVPMQSNEPIMMSGGGGSSGRASDILESIG